MVWPGSQELCSGISLETLAIGQVTGEQKASTLNSGLLPRKPPLATRRPYEEKEKTARWHPSLDP